jgi:hypothetical protein
VARATCKQRGRRSQSASASKVSRERELSDEEVRDVRLAKVYERAFKHNLLWVFLAGAIAVGALILASYGKLNGFLGAAIIMLMALPFLRAIYLKNQAVLFRDGKWFMNPRYLAALMIMLVAWSLCAVIIALGQ